MQEKTTYNLLIDIIIIGDLNKNEYDDGTISGREGAFLCFY